MVLDYEAITAIAALATSLVAIYAVWAENRRARFSQGIDLLMRLNERFDGQDLKAYRRVAAKNLSLNFTLAPTDDRASEIQQGKIIAGFLLPAHEQATEAIDP